ncbi:MAG: rRNA ((1498)-N(3))-methyltransferase [Gammaproteobacteria bacterium]|nr:rRNA ((1498)-N(3))-methyltransferase [Gammaproteobacteria bacterium]
MRLTRVFVDEDLNSGGVVELARDSAAHVAKVLRARSGDELVLFNGDGREFSGAIESVKGSRVFASIGAARIFDRESPFKVTLVQCIPRGDRMDFIVQKATELGVERIVPVLSQRSVVRLDASQAASKQAHWRAVAISACEQCGRNCLPALEAPLPLLHFLGAAGAGDSRVLRLVLEPERADEPRRAAGAALEAALEAGTRVAGTPVTGALIAIGPEGGFAPEELEAFNISSFSRLGLGPRVLRTETAAIAAIAILQSRFGDMSVLSDQGSRAEQP